VTRTKTKPPRSSAEQWAALEERSEKACPSKKIAPPEFAAQWRKQQAATVREEVAGSEELRTMWMAPPSAVETDRREKTQSWNRTGPESAAKCERRVFGTRASSEQEKQAAAAAKQIMII
jgi:hypothetical protein